MYTYQAFEQTFPGRGTAGYHVPDLVFKLVEFESFLDLLGAHRYEKLGVSAGSHSHSCEVHTSGNILFIRKHQQ